MPDQVPPPVDALLTLIAQYGQYTNDEAHGIDDAGASASHAFRRIETQATALYMAGYQRRADESGSALKITYDGGVAEGRRLRDEEIRREVFTSARQAAEEAGFGPVPERVTVSYTQQATAYEQGIYDAGIREGCRQAGAGVLAEVQAERVRQDARWGEQNHSDGTNLDNAEWRDHSRDLTEVAAKQGRVTWAHILQEEFVETLAEVEPARIRTELIQVAAVAVAWAQAIDRRTA